MKELENYLLAELPQINRCIEQEIRNLDPLTRPVAEHILLAGGKRLRPLLVILFYRAFGGKDKDITPLAASLEFLHSATLLHDDIIDGAELRRGRKAAHHVFGTTQTILAGDVLLALANRLVAEYGVPRLSFIVAEAIMRTAQGEILEISKMRTPDMTMDDYYAIVTGKTARMIQAACLCGAVAAGANDAEQNAASEFGLNLGIAFQVVDDLLDYSSTGQKLGKDIGSDLREGKLTLPLILFLRDLPGADEERICSRIREDSLGCDDIANLMDLVRVNGYVEQAGKEAGIILGKAEKSLDVLADSPEKRVLGQAVEYVLNRDR